MTKTRKISQERGFFHSETTNLFRRCGARRNGGGEREQKKFQNERGKECLHRESTGRLQHENSREVPKKKAVEHYTACFSGMLYVQSEMLEPEGYARMISTNTHTGSYDIVWCFTIISCFSLV